VEKKSMNTQLVDYLVGVITHLSPEEQSLLQTKLANHPDNSSPEETYQELLQLRAEIFARRQGKPLTVAPDDILHELREERDQQLMSVGLLRNSNND
jgi:hypothetical protein